MSERVVVIGGGIVGASAAYHAARSGAVVTLVDRADLGQATAAGAGIIAPGTSLRPLPAFFPSAYAAVAAYPALLDHLAADGAGETGYRTVGALFVAADEVEAKRLSEAEALFTERRRAGAPNLGDVVRLDEAAARALFPPLAAPGGALHLPDAVRVDGRLLRDALRRGAERHGATLLSGHAQPVCEGDRVTGVRVEDRLLPADALVIAAGAWSGDLGEALGVRLPVAPQRGQILHLDVPGQETADWPIVVGFVDHYLLTFPGGRVVAGATRETGSGFDPRMTAGGVHQALGQALGLAPGLASATLAEVRVGLRPASPDGLPILGRAPGLRNAYLATGHGPSGLQLGPFSGILAADMALGAPLPTNLDLAPFAPERFAAG